MPLFLPDTLDVMRILILIGTWVIIPLHLWTFWKVMRQIQIWREAEDSRIVRWREDMATSSRLLQECENLRHQAEISLAMARQSHARAAAPGD
jgi:hypothetical protein